MPFNIYFLLFYFSPLKIESHFSLPIVKFLEFRGKIIPIITALVLLYPGWFWKFHKAELGETLWEEVCLWGRAMSNDKPSHLSLHVLYEQDLKSASFPLCRRHVFLASCYVHVRPLMMKSTLVETVLLHIP